MARYPTSLVCIFLATSFTEASRLKFLTSRLLEFTDDDYYEEDSSIVQQGLDLLTDLAGQCMDPQMMNAVDPVASLFDKYEDYCTDSQVTEFESALKTYNDCTGTNLSDFIETFWSAMVGVGMTCAPYVYKSLKQMSDAAERLSITMPFKLRMPDECVDSLMGDNAFGDFYREHTIHPGKDRVCLAQLGRTVPDCTLRRWPVPIVGAVLKYYSCAGDKLAELTADMCAKEVRALSSCLPSVNEIKGASVNDSQCQSVVKHCSIDKLVKEEEYSVMMLLPSPLSAAPLSDTCADSDLSEEVSIRLEAFHRACSSNEDRAIWTQSGAGVATVSSTQRTRENDSSGNSTGKTLVFGFVIGIVCTLGLTTFISRKKSTENGSLVGQSDNSGRIGELS